jgi:hypothetical protein
VARIITDHADNTLATHHLALAAHFFDRSLHSHGFLHSLAGSSLPDKNSFGSEDDPALAQIVRGEFDRDLVARENADVVHAHLPGYVSQQHMAIFQFDPKRSVREVFNDLTLHLDNIVLRH